MSSEFPRQTFNKVLEAQDEVRDKLRKWAEDNTVVDIEEQNGFRSTFSRATLGLCHQVELSGGVHPAWSDYSLSKVLTILLKSDSEIISIGSRYDGKREKKKIRIGYLWDKLLQRLNEGVFDQAVTMAVRISPESDVMEDAFPYE
jgi:hypothetical protein